MTLRRKTLLIITGTLACLLMVLYVPVRLLVVRDTFEVVAVSLALVAVPLVFGLVTLVLLERLVLSRLSQLIAQVDCIGSSDPSARLITNGDDELTHLASAINDTLDALALSREEQRRDEQRARIEQESLRARREFISTVSHELRTPLTPIGGFADMLLLGVAGPLSPDQQAYVLTIKANAQRMTLLVDDLLEMGRIDAGRVELRIEHVQIQHTISQVVEQLRPEANQKQQRLTVDLPALPLVAADAKRIGQVVTNLLSNAIKYTDDGGQIVVRARALASGEVEVAVVDNGIGLTPEQQTHLFTPFYRADSPLRDQVAGTGLGLCIAKSFVELHGGTLSVTSARGQGSTFSFTLPIS